MGSGGKDESTYIIALDQGTTSSRAILFNHEGRIAGVAQREFEQVFPQPGWVEHDAEEIWQTQCHVARDVLIENDVSASQVVAIGITNQRETTVLWDRRTGKPIANAIVWQDRRTAGFCDELRSRGFEPAVQARTGLFLDPYFSGTKVNWLLDNIEGARSLANEGHLAFGTIDTWLIWNLTGGAKHVTDTSNASRTLLFNISELEWDADQLQMLDIPESVLPEVVPSSGVVGRTRSDILGTEIPIAGIAGDQQAALFGQRCTGAGMAKNTYGTGCFLLMNTGSEVVTSDNKLVSTIAWTIGDRTSYAIEGSVFVGGAVVQWLRDGIGIIESSGSVEPLARSVSSSDGVYLVPAFAGLGAPHWDPYARGAILGITRGTTSAHIARAALEAIAFQVDDVLEAMQADSGIALSELRVDGGASANDFLIQFQTNLLGVPALRPEVLETTALGAAYLAGLAVGFWQSEEELDDHWILEKRFVPEMIPAQIARLKAGWALALERSKAWSNNFE